MEHGIPLQQCPRLSQERTLLHELRHRHLHLHLYPERLHLRSLKNSALGGLKGRACEFEFRFLDSAFNFPKSFVVLS